MKTKPKDDARIELADNLELAVVIDKQRLCARMSPQLHGYWPARCYSSLGKTHVGMARVNLEGLEFLKSGQPMQGAVKRFVQAMSAAEQASLLERGGDPGRQAVDRLMAETFAKAYDSDDLVQLYAQAQDPEARVLAPLAPASRRDESA